MCIDDEIPFEIPAGWEWCRLGSILSIISDGTHKTPSYVEHGIPFLSVQNISSGELDLSKIKYITPEEHQQLISRVHPIPGDILVCRIGTLGKAIKITWDFEFSIFVSLGLLRPVLAELADYIVSYINSPWGNRWIQENKVGGGTHTYKINLGDFPNMMICIPPYQEQVRIKEKINLFEPSLKSYTKAQEQLDELNATINDKLKKSILQEAIEGKLVPQNPEDEPAEKLLKRIDTEKQRLVKEGKLKSKDAISSVIFKGEDNKYYEQIGSKVLEITDEIPFDIPNGWIWTRMSFLARMISGTSYDKSHICHTGIRILRGGNVVDYSISYLDDDVFLPREYTDIEKNIIKGDVVIVGSTGSFTAIGRPAFVREQQDSTQIGAFLRIVRPYTPLISQWIELIFRSQYYRDHISSCVKGTSINNIKASYILEMFVPLPPLGEQLRINSKINMLDCSL